MGCRTLLSLTFLAFIFFNHAPGQMDIAAAPTQPYGIPDENRWDRGGGYFTSYKQLTNTNRWYKEAFTTEKAGTEKIIPIKGLLKWDIKLEVRDTYFLNNACPINDTACYGEGDPVLFIHCYKDKTAAIDGGSEDL